MKKSYKSYKKEGKGSEAGKNHSKNNSEALKRVNILSDKLLSAAQKNILELSEKYGLNQDEILHLIKEQSTGQFSIPVSILKERRLGVLEIIVKYLKEEKSLSNHEIAKILKRDDRTIWATYNAAAKKLPERIALEFLSSKVHVHTQIFSNRSIGCLEALSFCLKNEGYSFHQIAQMTARNDRTIWTSYAQAKRKLGD